MSSLVGWLLGIFAMIIVLVVVELFSSGSRVSKIIKSVCTVVTLTVIVSPLPTLISNGFKTGSFSDLDYTPKLDENYLQYVTSSKMNVLAESIERELDEKFGKGISVSILGVGTEDVVIEKVHLNFSALVINGENANINRNEIAEYVAQRLSIKTETVSVYG